MQHFQKATLIYVTQGKASDGSPTEETFTRTIQVKEIKTFSLNFYTSNGQDQRNMRLSKNIVVPKWLTEDHIYDGKRYELLYVEFGGIRYHVKNVLKYYKSSLRMILDIEELR